MLERKNEIEVQRIIDGRIQGLTDADARDLARDLRDARDKIKILERALGEREISASR